MKLTQEENMTLDLMIASINDELKDALVADDREPDAEVLQAQYSLLRKLRQLAAAPAPAEIDWRAAITQAAAKILVEGVAAELSVPAGEEFKAIDYIKTQEALNAFMDEHVAILKGRAAPASTDAVALAPQKWTNWYGGEMPVSPDQAVAVIMRDGTEETRSARDYRWAHYEDHIPGADTNIVMYRVSTLPQLAAPDVPDAPVAAAAPGAVPKGWKLVPVTPTQEMCQVAQWKLREWPRYPFRVSPVYQAMLEAAPAAPVAAAAPGAGWKEMTKEQIAILARKVFDDRTAGWLLNGDACKFTLNDLSLLVDAVLAAAAPAKSKSPLLDAFLVAAEQAGITHLNLPAWDDEPAVAAPAASRSDLIFASRLSSAAQTIVNDYPHEAALLRIAAREYGAAPAQVDESADMHGKAPDEIDDLHKQVDAPETWKELPSKAGAPPLDDDLRFILGRPCFTLIGMANVLRQMGYEIASRAEDEQAVSIHWMLDLYMKHGKAWREEATQILDVAKEAAKGRLVSLNRNQP